MHCLNNVQCLHTLHAQLELSALPALWALLALLA